MLDQELMTPPPPTPHELLKVLVDVYGPPPNPTNPFKDTKQTALKRLTAGMLKDAFGPYDPLSHLVTVVLESHIHPDTSLEIAQKRLEKFQRYVQEIEYHLELAASGP